MDGTISTGNGSIAMGMNPGDRIGVVRVRRDLSDRLRVAAAMANEPVERLVTPVIAKAIGDIEAKAKSQFRATIKPSRGTPPTG
jgi:hypothetical protein